VLITGVSGTAFGTVLCGVHDAGLDVPVISLGSNMTLKQMAQFNGILPRELHFGCSRGAVIEPNATATQLRDYIGGLQNWIGIDGAYDFHRIPQRGIGDDGAILNAWSAAKSDFTVASKPQGRL
jgi:hypothetical protein